MLGKLTGPLIKFGVPVAKNFLAPLTTMASVFAIDGTTQKRIRGRVVIAKSGASVIRPWKGIILVISNEDMDDIIKTIKLIEDSSVLIEEASETVKHKIKKQEGRFFSMILGTLGASILGNMLTGKGVLRAGRGYSNMDHIDKIF